MNKITLVRSCVSCGKKKFKNEFIRVVRSPKKYIDIDYIIVEPKRVFEFHKGRSAYICVDLLCLKKARKSKRFEKKLSLKFVDDFYEQIENIINKNLN